MLVEQIDPGDEDFRVDANEGVGDSAQLPRCRGSRTTVSMGSKINPSAMEHQSSIGASFREKGDSDVWAGQDHQGLVRRSFRDGVLPGPGIVCDADCNMFDGSCPHLDEYAASSWLRLWLN